MIIPQRVRLHRTAGWKLPANTVHCARPSGLGNPFVVGVDGDRSECIERCQCLLGGWIQTDTKACRIDQVKFFLIAHNGRGFFAGKNLACWCKPELACHVDILLPFFNPERRPS